MRFVREGTISSWTAAFLVERIGFLSVRVVDSACWVYIPTKMSGFLPVEVVMIVGSCLLVGFLTVRLKGLDSCLLGVFYFSLLC